MAGLILKQEQLLSWLNATGMLGDSWLVISIALWASGNVIQHTYGTFTLSYRNGFGFAYVASLGSLVLVGGALITSYLLSKNLGFALSWAGGIYSLCSLTYVWHVRRAIFQYSDEVQA
jgi:drug/metabolite transporter superfamily protein YnfA